MSKSGNNKDIFLLRGSVIYSETPDKLNTFEDAYLVCENGISRGVFPKVPEEYKTFPVHDTGGSLIIPGFTDLHIHAPQYRFRGNGYDLELLDWLQTYTFPEESKYKDMEYAEESYRMFTGELRSGFTTRACVFASAYPESTLLLMEMLENSGLKTFVGKVNMDRNVPDYYVESTEESIDRTLNLLEEIKQKGFNNTKPIITPRFTPACTMTLMKELGKIAEKYDIPVQSHLSENKDEQKWVEELESDCSGYGDTYKRAGLMGKDRPCIMAHCVWSDDKEQELLKKNRVFIAHCPESNMNLCSGAAPVKKYLRDGQLVGLATDISGGSSASMLDSMKNAIQASKLRSRLFDEKLPPLTFSEVFFLATRGSGAFFKRTSDNENVGSFENGFSFDALVLDDRSIPGLRPGLTVTERAERFMYLGNESYIRGKYVSGKKLF